MASVTNRRMPAEYENLCQDLNGALYDVFMHRQISTDRFMQLYSNLVRYCGLTQRPLEGPGSKYDVRRQVFDNNTPEDVRVETLLLNDYVAGNLYQRIRNLITAIVTGHANEAQLKSGDDLVTFYAQFWNRFHFSAKVADCLCQCLDRQCFIPWKSEAADGHFTFKLAMRIWKEVMFSRHHQRVVLEVLRMILCNRSGEEINTGNVKQVVESLYALGTEQVTVGNVVTPVSIYKTKFEDAFIRDTRDFYGVHVGLFLAQPENGPLQYIQKVNRIMEVEQLRVTTSLHPSTHDRLMDTLQQVLIQNQLPSLEIGFGQLLVSEANDARAHLTIIYDFVKRLNVDAAFNEMRMLFRKHVAKEGRKALRNLSEQEKHKPEKFIGAINSVYTAFLEMVNSTLKKDLGFRDALGKGCEDVVNGKSEDGKIVAKMRSAEILARYCNNLLRKGGAESEEDLQESMDRALAVFKFLDDKDEFSAQYRRFFANRVVNKLTIGNDAEKEMLEKLKGIYGFDFTMHMERMLNDAKGITEINDKFLEWVVENKDLIPEPITVGFFPMILTSRSWPFSVDTDNELFVVPNELVPSVNTFQIYYSAHHRGRRLNWIYSKSKTEVASNCFRFQYTFDMFAYNCAVLLLFNDALSYFVHELLEATRLNEELLTQIVQLFMKSGLLTSEDPMNQITLNSKVSLNEVFAHRKRRINLAHTLKQEARLEQANVHTQVDEGRKFQVQAAIVRVMKARKVLEYQILVGETMQVLSSRFQAAESMIRQQVGKLTQGESPVLKVKQGTKNVYEYIS